MFEENNCIELERVFSQVNIEYTGVNVFLDDIFNYKHKYILSIFPSIINNNDKYNQVNVFYQRYLDREISGNLFMKFEEHIHEFVKTLWIYSETYVLLLCPPNNLNRINCDRKLKKTIKKSKFLKNLVVLNKKNDSVKRMVCINEYDELKNLLLLATRELSGLLLYLKEYHILVYLFGCEGIVISSEEVLSSGFIQCILSNNNLYMWKTNNEDQSGGGNQSGDGSVIES